MSVCQNDFIAALFDADQATPSGLCNPQGTAAIKRFSVYRNNVAASLTEALEATFPTVQKLLGADFFKAMAGVFWRQHPPNSPVLMRYGSEMPGFLAGFGPVSHLGYLPDISRIELGLTQSYHAADVAPIKVEILQKIAPDDLLSAQIRLAPAVYLIRSKWPAGAIYHANNDSSAPKPVMQPEDVLISRLEFDPVVTVLPDGAGAFVEALMQGQNMGEAVKMADRKSSKFELTQVLGLLLSTGSIIEIIERDL